MNAEGRGSFPLTAAVVISAAAHLALLAGPRWPGPAPVPPATAAGFEVDLRREPSNTVSSTSPPASAQPLLPDDGGDIPLDTPDPRYRGYFDLIRARIATTWHVPRLREKVIGEPSVLLRFALDGLGKITWVKVARSSGREILDRAAVDAVRAVSPLPPKPVNIERDPLVVSALFIYEHEH